MLAHFNCFFAIKIKAGYFCRFGRKKTILAYCIIKLVGIVMAIFSQNYATFVIGRFLVASSFGYVISGYVLGKNIENTFSLYLS